MRRIGDLWPTNKRAILFEHRASNICIDALDRLRSTFPTPPDEYQIAIGRASENDPYVLPSLMATTVLSDLGFQAINLGPNTPLSVLADSALELNVKLVWVACTAPLRKAALENDLQRASERLQDRRVQMALGGQALARYRSPGRRACTQILVDDRDGRIHKGSAAPGTEVADAISWSRAGDTPCDRVSHPPESVERWLTN